MSNEEYTKAVIKRRACLVGSLIGVLIGLGALAIALPYLSSETSKEIFVGDMVLVVIMGSAVFGGVFSAMKLEKHWLKKI